MKASPRKNLLSSNTQILVLLDNGQITSCVTEKLLRLTFDLARKCEEHINKFCNIVNKNLLSHIVYQTSLGKQKVLLKAFIEAGFIYFQLIFRLHLGTNNY